MHLGAFSISLAVSDLTASRKFYEALGFEVFHGDPDQHWLMLRNGDAVVGLFEGMFEANILTFNPGWDQAANNLDEFTDIRDIQKHLKSRGIELESETDESANGPGSLTLQDPDGNRIMLDQHR